MAAVQKAEDVPAVVPAFPTVTAVPNKKAVPAVAAVATVSKEAAVTVAVPAVA